jgi:hypothetical protein
MAKKGIPLIVYLDKELDDWLGKMHDEEGYPKTVLVRLALREYKARCEQKPTSEGCNDRDRTRG